jgi:diguanylate cyclase (GGDEF)-like protein
LRTVGLTLAFTVLALIVRAADALIDPTQFNSYFQASLGNSLTYLACFLFPLGAGFGFVLANLERMAHRLDRLASFDTLTGCLSRAVFDTTLIRAIQQAYREREGLALINLDLDHFKQINDTHGHLAGDRVLRSVAAALRDRLSLGQVLGRLGGDEFGIILPQTDGISAIRLAEELRQMVESLEIRDPAGVALRISLSIGVSSVAPGTQPTLEALYLEADRALYEAKFRGRNRTQHFEPIGVQGAPPQNASFGVATSPGARREPMQVGPAA